MPAVPPIITSVSCTAGLPLPSFSLGWQVQEGYTGPFTIVVVDGGGNVVPGTAAPGPNGGVWTATAQSNMQASQTYQVKVGVNQTPDIYSDPQPLLFTPPTQIATVYDGKTLMLTWTPPASGPPPGSMMVLLLAGSYAQAGIIDSTTGGVFIPNPALVPTGGAWSVMLTPQQGVSSGPASDPATVYNGVPAIAAMATTSNTASGANVEATTPAAGYSAGAAFILTLWANGQAAYSTAPIAGTPVTVAGTDYLKITAALPAPPAPLDPGCAYAVTLTQAATVGSRTSRGPYGLPSALLPDTAGVISVQTAIGGTAADRTVSVTIAPAPGPAQPSGATAQVLDAGGTAVKSAAGPGFTQTVALTAPTIGAAYSVVVAPMIGPSQGLTSASTPVLTTQPVLASADYDGRRLAAAWTGTLDPGATGYRLEAVDGAGAVLASAFTTTLAADITIPAQATGIQVRAAGGVSTGPASAAAAPLALAPADPYASWTAASGDGALNWTAVPGAGGYAVTVLSGSDVVYQSTVAGGSTTTCALPAGTLAPDGLYAFVVRATSASGATPALTGPASAPAPVLAAAPRDVTIAWDGATLQAGWSPATGAAGYKVTVLDGSTTVGTPIVVTGLSAATPLAYDAAKTYTVVVQAVNGASSGPPSQAVDAFQNGFFLSSDPQTTPYLKPTSGPSMAAFDLVLLLPDLFTSPPGTFAPNPTFVMAAGTAPYAYTLTIAAASKAWTFDANPIRTALRDDYAALLTDLEAKGATPLGLATVQQAIARAMPQTYAETLFYSYGLRADQGYIDLKPGTVLRAEYESYQYLGAGVPDQAYLNGYVATASAEYQVAAYVAGGSWMVGLDRFLAVIASGGGVTVPTPATSQGKAQGGGGLIDTVYSQFQRPFVRLVYPPSFLAQNTAGQPYPQYNALLVAATKLDALETATANLRSGVAAGADVALLYFRGRTTLTAGLQVWVDGESLSAPIGTTVGNVLDTRAARPPTMPMTLSGLRLDRALGTAVTTSAPAYDVGGGQPVRLDWSVGAQASWLELPLLHGDRLRIVGSGAS